MPASSGCRGRPRSARRSGGGRRPDRSMSSSSAKTSAVAPARTTRPSAITTVRSAYSVTSCMSCVTTRIVVPSSLSSRSSASSSSARARSCPNVGSSRASTGAPVTSAVPDREPPLLAAREEERMRAAPCRSSPNRSSSAVRALAHLVVGEVAQPQAVRDLVEDGVRDELVLGVLEDEPDRATTACASRCGRRRGRRRARCRAAAG